MPIIWIIGILLLGLFNKNPKNKRKYIISGIALLLFFSNDFLVNQAYRLWEYQVVPIEKIEKNYDVGIILGGFTDIGKIPRDRVYLSQGADRMMHSLQLYKLNKIKKIVATGGSGLIDYKPESEAESIEKVLLLCGLNANDIILEPEARNTHENAIYTAKLIKNKFPNATLLLFTSAFHCRRAKACFEKQGLMVDVFPVDFRYSETGFNLEKILVPSENALSKWGLLVHEIVGYLVYKIMGYA